MFLYCMDMIPTYLPYLTLPTYLVTTNLTSCWALCTTAACLVRIGSLCSGVVFGFEESISTCFSRTRCVPSREEEEEEGLHSWMLLSCPACASARMSCVSRMTVAYRGAHRYTTAPSR